MFFVYIQQKSHHINPYFMGNFTLSLSGLMREKAEILQVPSPLIPHAVYKYGQRWIYYV